MSGRRILPFLGLAAILGLAWYLTHGRGEPKTGLTLYGNVDIREVELSFRVAGRIQEMRVDEGDRVEPGDLLALLDPRPYQDTLAKAQAEQAVAQASVAKHHAGYRREEVAQARAQVAELEARVENAKRLARRREALLKNGAVSVQDAEDATYARDSLDAQLLSARKALELQVAGYRVEDVAAAEAQLASAKASVASAQTDLADTRIISPSDGQVLSRVREPGAMASAGSTVLVVSLDRPAWVRAYVDEPSLGKVHLGMPVEVFTDSRPDRPYRGQVGFISPVAEFTPKNVETQALRTDLVYRLRIVVDEPDQGLRQGMPVTVRPLAEPSTGPAKEPARQ